MVKDEINVPIAAGSMFTMFTYVRGVIPEETADFPREKPKEDQPIVEEFRGDTHSSLTSTPAFVCRSKVYGPDFNQTSWGKSKVRKFDSSLSWKV